MLMTVFKAGTALYSVLRIKAARDQRREHQKNKSSRRTGRRANIIVESCPHFILHDSVEIAQIPGQLVVDEGHVIRVVHDVLTQDKPRSEKLFASISRDMTCP